MTEREDPSPLRPHFIVVPGQALLDDRLSDKAKLLLGILSWIGGEDGRVWPRVRRIAVSLGVEARRARMLFAEVVAAGYAKKVGTSEWGTTVYQLTYTITVNPRQEIASPSALTDRAPEATKCRDINTSRRRPAAAVVPEAVEKAAEPYLRMHSHPDALLYTLRSHLLGPAKLIATEEQVVTALSEMQAANVAHFGPVVFRKFLRRAIDGDGSTPTLPGRRSSMGDGLASIAKRREAK